MLCCDPALFFYVTSNVHTTKGISPCSQNLLPLCAARPRPSRSVGALRCRHTQDGITMPSYASPLVCLLLLLVPRLGFGDQHNSSLLERLAYHYGSDKARDDHGYVKAYSMLFDARRYHVNEMVEIGVASGQSMQIWARYFPRATVRGVDIKLRSVAQEIAHQWHPRVQLFELDSTDAAAIARSMNLQEGSQDIIIDDGLHEPTTNQRTLEAFWPYLRPGGYYVIEDIATGADPSGQSYVRGKPRSPSGTSALAHSPNSWSETTRAILEGNDVLFLDTLVGHRDFDALRKKMGTSWMESRVNHNSHMLVILKRTQPLPALQINAGSVAMTDQRVKLKAMDDIVP